MTKIYEDEIKLIEQCQAGCQESFDKLYRKYRLVVMQIAREMMRNEQDAEDAVQEVFERVLDKISQFRYEASFSSWLRVLAINLCKDILRKKARQTEESIDKINTTLGSETYKSASSFSQEEELIMKELLEDLEGKISHLKREHQRLIVLRYIDGLSYKKIAQLLGCSQPQVKSRLHQARRNLRRICESLRSNL